MWARIVGVIDAIISAVFPPISGDDWLYSGWDDEEEDDDEPPWGDEDDDDDHESAPDPDEDDCFPC